ncbi:MAG: PAS domain S-box protein [Candidatus Edwardsbacteria bacterium]|nr:PAS domain S-box protein [Candidatus Edwardsbacteria bacterium]MBU1577116.1 PAS domain S-box protein [Candidatus Edwardsbacteria bacterium]MBU2463806.1 PAS domain S-box protein [Candidatus Edwardsbacteria bacterium]MBU2593788.1 PAS domain S-box protein [Candidatus Edwardsbacteria bacterium]
MNKRQVMEKIPFKLLAVFGLLLAAILAGGYLYYKQQNAQTVEYIKNELQTISEYKVNQIYDWRKERFGDAFVLTSSEILIFSVRRWLKDPTDKTLYNYIYTRLDAFRIYDTYKDVILVDPAGKIRFFMNQKTNENISPSTLSIVKEAVRKREILFSDFYYCDNCQEVNLDVVAPLFDQNGLAATVILRIDPSKFLYPFVQSWPRPSRTGETVLVRRDGDEVLFLNDLRHQKNAALTFRLPLSDTLLPATMAVLGQEGLVEGLDYRKVPVLASIRQIKGSSWYMVVKINKEEIYTPLYRQKRNIAIAVVALLAATFLALGFLWQSDRRGFYKKQYKQELERQALIKHYDYLAKYANDIILLSNDKYQLVEVNDRAVEAYGYSREELIGKSAEIFRSEESKPLFKRQMEEMQKKGGMIFETVQRRKDGSTFPVEISARPMEIEGKRYMQAIVRDITERKQYELAIKERNQELKAANEELQVGEEELRHTNEELEKNYCELEAANQQLTASEEEIKQSAVKWAITFDAIMDGVSLLDAEQNILQANKAFADYLGLSYADIIGRKCYELIHSDGRPDENCPFARMMQSKKRETMELSIGDRIFDVLVDPIIGPSGAITSAVHIISDITERKKAQAKLQEQLSELQRWQNTMLDREDRVMELKKEINELLAKLGQPKKYGE